MVGKRGRQSGRETQKKNKERNRLDVIPTEFDLQTARKDEGKKGLDEITWWEG